MDITVDVGKNQTSLSNKSQSSNANTASQLEVGRSSVIDINLQKTSLENESVTPASTTKPSIKFEYENTEKDNKFA